MPRPLRSRLLAPCLLAPCLVALGALHPVGAAQAQTPQVATDIAPVHALTARVMEGVGTPRLVIQPGASPHEYRLRPSEAAALQDADVVFWVGPALTPWMADAVRTLAEDASVTLLMERAETERLPFREGALFEAHAHGDKGDDADHGDHAHGAHDNDHAHGDHAHGDHAHGDHAHGDHAEAAHAHDAREHDHAHDNHGHADHGHGDHGHGHGAEDPHVWLSPRNASAWLTVIAAQLSSADPANAGTYFANAVAAEAEIEAMTAEIDAMLAPVRGGRFIVFHDAYQYFETAFDIPASGAISLSDAADPSPARIAEIRARVADEGVDCVLAEPQFNPGLVATVLDGVDARTGVIDPLGAALTPGADFYPALMRGMARALVDCLS